MLVSLPSPYACIAFLAVLDLIASRALASKQSAELGLREIETLGAVNAETR